MASSEAVDRFSFNAYDLFSNFLPGTVLLIGISVPFLNPNNLLPSLNLVEAFSATILAFGVGIATQSIGSMISRWQLFGWPPWHKRDRPFNEKMNQLLDPDLGDDDHSNIDIAARRLCAEVFELNCDGCDNCEHLFKALLSYLESSKWSRTIRIQTLHLASRGLYISCLILMAYYASIALGLFLPLNIPVLEYNGHFAVADFFLWSIGMVPLSWVLFRRARHFEEDVVVYILSEFYLSQYDWDQLDMADIDDTDPNDE